MKKYSVIFTMDRTVLISPDGSSFIINSTTDNEFMYGFASVNLFCRMYEGYLSQFMSRPDNLLWDSYNSSLCLPWYNDDHAYKT